MAQSEHVDGTDQLPKVLLVLRHLFQYPNGIGLGQLSRELDLPKSTVHRALAALRAAEFVSQDDATRYRLHLSLVQAALRTHESMDEVALVRPLLEEIATELGEAAHYGVKDGAYVVYVAKVNAPNQRVQMSSSVGGRNPLYCTGIGKALLAYEEEVEELLAPFIESRGRLHQRTPNTISDLAVLRREMIVTRERGYAVDREENEPGICCVAIPLFFGPALRPTGAVSVTALVLRTPLAELERRVKDLGVLIERRLPGVRAGSALTGRGG